MVGSFEFEAELRHQLGKGASRRLRHAGKVPAVLYGGGGEPVPLLLEHHKVVKSLENEATYSHVLTIRFDGREESAILKAVQRHPAKPIVMHMDFLRVNAADKIRVHVPLHFINQESSVGVKRGGVVSHSMVDVEVHCFSKDLPEYIEVDLAQLDIGDIVHLSDLKLPAGVEIHALTQGAGHDLPVVSVHAPRTAESGEGEAG
ncbi:50S ribosomal protein L25/general stress protein Ctc [Methylococcus geothermalis]|uniref:Large ribosomal subunit protein bL25 n=1 Tax=Methylococcus geothermalis TaxID=2681310 RepID=A0A858QAP0_9GAMM|nr:50S ribosomal protein L25/general stress protein Ctc [Methylococcus geothermalis]QJD30746.1 50S ribosomal protein L25/general stress protein Ctc [Methylococcus geothermalis]